MSLGMHGIADTLLKQSGFVAEVKKYSETDFDIEEGESVRSLSDQFQGYAIFNQFFSGKKSLTGALLQEQSYSFKSGDKGIIINIPLNKTLDLGDSITIEGVVYAIAFIEEIKDQLETAVHKVIIREESGV